MIPPCLTLSNTRYVLRVKRSNPGKEVAPSPTRRCNSYGKGSLLVTLDYGRQLLLYQKSGKKYLSTIQRTKAKKRWEWISGTTIWYSIMHKGDIHSLQVKMKLTVIPIIVGTLRTIPKDLEKRLGKLEICGRIESVQLNSARIPRRWSGTEDCWLVACFDFIAYQPL